MTTEGIDIPPGAHPQAAEALQQLGRFGSALQEQMRRVTSGSYLGTDEAKSVEVTVDGARCLTGLYLEDGLLRLGAEAVGERINEALRSAQAAASAGMQEQYAQLFANLSEISDSLVTGLGYDVPKR